MRHPFTFEATCKHCDVVLTSTCIYEPDCPPKPCSDHDHPAFSDPGSPASIDDYPETCPGCGAVVDVEDLFRQGEAAFTDWAEGQYEDAMIRKYEDWRDRDDR